MNDQLIIIACMLSALGGAAIGWFCGVKWGRASEWCDLLFKDIDAEKARLEKERARRNSIGQFAAKNSN